MTDADDMAQRYLDLWTRYLTALLADPGAMQTLKRWTAFTGQFSSPQPTAGQASGDAPFPAWPPFFGPFGVPSAPPGAGEALTEAITVLTRRVEELERRLAALERPKNKPKPRGKTRPSKI